MTLARNMGPIDQVFRTLMGVACMYLGPFSDWLTSDFISGVLLALVGLLVIISSLAGFCPFYYAAGFNTYREPGS